MRARRVCRRGCNGTCAYDAGSVDLVPLDAEVVREHPLSVRVALVLDELADDNAGRRVVWSLQIPENLTVRSAEKDRGLK